MSQSENSSTMQLNQTKEHLEWIVFNMNFEKASKSPVHILHKGPFMSLFEYYLLNCHKTEKETKMNQTDEIKMLVKSLEKWFDDKEFTMQLIRDRLINEQTN